MADRQQFDIIRQGSAPWNAWRRANPEVRPDLREAVLEGLDLREADLSDANLNGAVLRKVQLSGADLRGADMRGADLSRAILDGVDFSRSTIDSNTRYDGVQGCDIGVNGLYSASTDSAALMRIDPPGNSMQGANAEAVIESLKQARKLHTFSLLLAGIALLFIVIKPKTVTLPYLAGSFKFDEFTYTFLATILSTLLLTQVSSFLDSALRGAHCLNDRRAAMLVGHFPWLLSKYERKPASRRHSKIQRFFLVFHPLVYIYFFVKWDALMAGDWQTVLDHYHEMPVLLGEYILPVLYVILFLLCLHIFRISEGFQRPILFDTVTERERRSDMDRLVAVLEKQANLTTEMLDLLGRRKP